MAKDFYEQYITELLTKINLVEEGGKVDVDYVKELAEEMKKSVGLMIMEALPTDKMEAYTELVHGSPNQEAVLAFLKENIDDFEAKRMKKIEDFAVSFVDRTTKMREALK